MAIVYEANPNLGRMPRVGEEVAIRNGVFKDLWAIVLDVDATGAVIAEVPGLIGPDGADLVTTMERSEYLAK